MRKKLQAEGINVRPGPLTNGAQPSKTARQSTKRKKTEN